MKKLKFRLMLCMLGVKPDKKHEYSILTFKDLYFMERLHKIKTNDGWNRLTDCEFILGKGYVCYERPLNTN